MSTASLPKCNMDNSETGCCPRFDPAPWDGQEFALHERLFVRATTINFMHREKPSTKRFFVALRWRS